uniref:Uncharacterized protein n=1 Tax=Anopheles atroparvus TaxID=41427 RepID=A0A182JHD8_ANOAO
MDRHLAERPSAALGRRCRRRGDGSGRIGVTTRRARRYFATVERTLLRPAQGRYAGLVAQTEQRPAGTCLRHRKNPSGCLRNALIEPIRILSRPQALQIGRLFAAHHRTRLERVRGTATLLRARCLPVRRQSARLTCEVEQPAALAWLSHQFPLRSPSTGCALQEKVWIFEGPQGCAGELGRAARLDAAHRPQTGISVGDRQHVHLPRHCEAHRNPAHH